MWEHRYQLGMITNTDTITKRNTRIENKYKYRVVCSCVWERRCKPDMISGSTAACHSAQGGIASISSTLGFIFEQKDQEVFDNLISPCFSLYFHICLHIFNYLMIMYCTHIIGYLAGDSSLEKKTLKKQVNLARGKLI